MNKEYVLVTGGAGYIGSHTCVELLDAGFDILVLDNLINSSSESINRVRKITGKSLEFIEGDILDKDLLENIFTEFKIVSVIHFAGFKAVGESNSMPLKYYWNNVAGTVLLLEAMKKYNVKNFVFSSSATVYGNPKQLPIQEHFPTSTTNPYGESKLVVENILSDLYKSDDTWNIIVLRYFNPVGAHESGDIGEDPSDIPNNLMPYITQVAIGELKELQIFGDDYETFDGTGVRDYIHVVDLAKGHVKSILKMSDQIGYKVYNLGTGTGFSVLEMVKSFEKITGVAIPFKVVGRREGDIAACYADPTLSKSELNWEAELSLDDMIRSAWLWQSRNQNGYMG